MLDLKTQNKRLQDDLDAQQQEIDILVEQQGVVKAFIEEKGLSSEFSDYLKAHADATIDLSEENFNG